METFRVERYEKTRFFAVRDATNALICVCVYRKGAQEVAAPAVWVDPMPWLL